MKKLLLLLIALTFLAVSCSSSKKAENDTDILPDEDATDVDEDNLQPDEDVTDVDEDNLQPDEDNGGTGPSFVNICTGLTKCYNNEKEIKCPKQGKDFYGQDVNYAELETCVPQKFKIDDSIENEPVVIDLNTGLEWQQNFFEAGDDYTEVYNYCENLNYGGHDDWRMPTISEFFSIVDRDRFEPAINTDYFPKTPSNDFWTSSGETVSDTLTYFSAVWLVNFAKGEAHLTTFSNKLYVRCVRGNDSFWAVEFWYDFGVPEMTYINDRNKKSEIFMAETNYSKPTWEEALNYCLDKNYAGISGWRLPNINEISFFLLDIHRNAGRNVYYWTSTSYAEKPDYSWAFKLDGNSIPSIVPLPKKNIEEEGRIVCVHDAPCENGLAWTGTECTDLCKPNPCKDAEHSTGKCEQNILPKLTADSYSCICDSEDAFWNKVSEKCVNLCDPNPCEADKHSDGVCTVHKYYTTDHDTGYEHYCGCKNGYMWNGQYCSDDWALPPEPEEDNYCDPNPCEEIEHSNGICFNVPSILYHYGCECDEGYEWNWESMDCVADETAGEISDADTDETPDETPDSDNSENGE